MHDMFSSTLNNVPHEQCYCIPKSVTGLRVSDMQVPQKERLIVYLYKNVFGEVTLHIPSRDKQSVLPDLPIDTNDILEGNVAYPINELFRSNMSHMLIEEDNTYTFPDTDPYMHTNPEETGNSYLHWSTHSQKHPGIPKRHDHRGNEPDSEIDDIPLEDVTSLYTTLTGKVVRPLKKGNDHVLRIMEMFNKKVKSPFSWISGKPIDTDLVGLTEVTDPKVLINTLPLQGFHTGLSRYITKQPYRITSGLDKLDYLNNIPHLKQFEFWLRSQMNNLKQNKLYSKFAVGIKTLKVLLIKALLNNGIRISHIAGTLIDSNGNIISMDNVKLNPVLLGDPMEYERRFAVKGCLSQQELPHIETVLMSTSNPPRILATIPLGKNLLTSKFNTLVPMCSQSNRKPGSRCRHLSLVGSDENGPFNRNIVLNSLYRRKNSEAMENLETPTLNTNESLRTDEDVEHGKDDIKTPEEVITKIEENGTNDDYDDLGIRVLGGSSATSSGAPINNKGRSGMA